MIQRRVLLVEDESNLRRTLTDFLMSEGYAVDSSGDGLEAQELATTQFFDIIVLDVMLPSCSGFDVCRHLRKNGINTPILMLTKMAAEDRKSTRLNSSHEWISYAVFCLKKKNHQR